MRQRTGESYEDFRVRVNTADRERYARFKMIRVTESPAGTSTVYAPEREPYEPLPGATLARRSTLVDAEGNVIQAWHIEKPEDRARYEAMKEAIDELTKDLPRAPIIPAPNGTSLSKLATVYPIGDHHLGMLSWKHETGASYDLDIGEQLLASATDHLVAQSPPSAHALIAFLGDYVHYDSMVPETPHGRNPLDSDGRASKMVRVAMRSMRRMIEAVARKHQTVHVIIEFGNHDPYSMLWLMEAMRIKYEDNPRITIDCAPGAYHYYRFGKCMFGTHHGDQTKMANLPLIMATDRPDDWAASTHRLWMTGHIHQSKVLDLQGCTVESFRILAPGDAWAHMKGYRSHRDMKAIVFHHDNGEVARYTFNPDMLET